MDSEAASEWLKTAASTVGRIQSTYLAIGVFSLTVLLTLLTQHWQLIQAQKKAQAVDVVLGLPWDKMDRLYEEFPADYIEKQVMPWYYLSLKLVFWTTDFQQTSDPKGQNHKLETALSQMSYAIRRLRDYNLDLRSVEGARKLQTPFDNLDRTRLTSLVRVSHFEKVVDALNLDRQHDDEFTNGLKNVTLMATLAVNGYDQIKEKPKDARYPPDFFDSLRSRPPKFLPLDSVLAANNYGQFANSVLTEAERKALFDALKSTSFGSVGDLKRQKATLEEEIRQATNAAVKLPVIDLTISMPTFGTLALFLNATLLGWVASLIFLLRNCLDRYRALSPTPNEDLILAVTAGLPIAFGRRTIAKPFNTLILCFPGTLGTLYFLWLGFNSGDWKGMRLILPLALSIALLGLFIIGQRVASLAFQVGGGTPSDFGRPSTPALAEESDSA